MLQMKTQDLMGIAEKLGTLAAQTASTEEKIIEIQQTLKNGLPSCKAHAEKMLSLEKRLERMPVGGGDSFGFGKYKATGTAALLVGIILAVGGVLVMVLKVVGK